MLAYQALVRASTMDDNDNENYFIHTITSTMMGDNKVKRNKMVNDKETVENNNICRHRRPIQPMKFGPFS